MEAERTNTKASIGELTRRSVLTYGDGYRTRRDELGPTGFPILRVAQIADGFVHPIADLDHIREEYRSAIGAKVSRPHDVVLTTKGTFGRRAYLGAGEAGYAYSPQVCWFRVLDEDRLAPRFLYYWLGSQDFLAQARGMTFQTDMADYLSLRDLARIVVPLPPIREQRAIAHILGTLDDKIRLNRRMSETLEAMARTLFKSWFVDFDPVRAKAEGRDPGLPQPFADLFPACLVDSELGEIPEGWEVGELGELVDTVKGRAYKSEELVESDTALVTLKSFSRGGGYKPEGLKSFGGTYRAEQVVDPGEVVIACTDVTQAAEVIGRPAIVRGTRSYRRLVASLDTMIVRPRDSRMTRAFLYFLGGTEAFVTHTYAHTTGTTVLHLAKEAVPSFTFARPSKQLVQRFDALASPMSDRVAAVEEESRTLSALRDALLPRLISGAIRIRHADAILGSAA